MITNQKKLENKSNKNNFFMNLAFLHANRIIGNTGTNPAVGCVIVKNGCVISSGHTSYKGRPHAESNALKKGDKKNIFHLQFMFRWSLVLIMEKQHHAQRKLQKFPPKALFIQF